MERRNWNKAPIRQHLSIPRELKLTRLVRKSRPIHWLKRTTIRNQARRLVRSYSQSGVAHAPKLKLGFGARSMNNFGATIRTTTI